MIKKMFRRMYKYSHVTAAAHLATDWIGSVQSLMVHTVLFAVSFSLVFFGFAFEQILLVVTTIVSLEAIYLAIFIQMAINQQSQSLDAVEEDIDEIQRDIDEIEKDVDEIQEGIDEIEKEEDQEQARDLQNKLALEKIESSLAVLILEIEKMKKNMR